MYTSPVAVNPVGIVNKYLLNSAGSNNLAVNGAVTPQTFKAAPLSELNSDGVRVNETWVINNIHLMGRALAGTSVHTGFFGAPPGIYNGFTLQVKTKGQLLAIHDPDPAAPANSLYPIISNDVLGDLTGNVALVTEGTDLITSIWDLKSCGCALRLQAGDSFQIVVTDNLSTFPEIYVKLLGHVEVA